MFLLDAFRLISWRDVQGVNDASTATVYDGAIVTHTNPIIFIISPHIYPAVTLIPPSFFYRFFPPDFAHIISDTGRPLT